MAIANGQIADADDLLNSLNAAGELELKASSELTIAAGVVTVTQNFHRIDTEGDASSDDLDTITKASDMDDGYVLVLRPEHTDRTVVIKHGTGNIRCPEGAHLSMDASWEFVLLIYDSNLVTWNVVTPPPGLLSVTAASLAADAVTTAKILDANVTFAKLAATAGVLKGRQGGSATDWSSAGTTNYAPTAVRQQGGSLTTHGTPGVATRVTFPTAFSDVPIAFLTLNNATPATVYLSAITSTYIDVKATVASMLVHWLAIGPG